MWGLSIATPRGRTAIGIEEPPLFSEPGFVLIRPDQTVDYLSVQSMRFVRPNLAEMVQARDIIIKHDCPARGEYTAAARGAPGRWSTPAHPWQHRWLSRKFDEEAFSAPFLAMTEVLRHWSCRSESVRSLGRTGQALNGAATTGTA